MSGFQAPGHVARDVGHRHRALAAAYPLGVALAVVMSVVVGRHSGGSVVALALGLFAALLTAITLVIILTLDVDSRWPSLQDIVTEAFLVRWFLLAMTAVTLAAFFDDSIEARWLTTLAIMLALASGFLGSLSLYHLFRISTGEGRRHFLGRVLGREAERASLAVPRGEVVEYDAAAGPAFAAYLSRFQGAVDSGDIGALRDRVAELDIAGGVGGPSRARMLLALDLTVLRGLGRAVVLGRLDSPEVGSALFPALGRLIVNHAGQALSRSEPRQLSSATYLGHAARTFAWINGAAYREAVEKGHAPPALSAVAGGCVTARDQILDAVDPSSSGHLPEDHPWHRGLVEPSAALIWWWCFCDLNGTHDGRAFYAAIFMLTGQKFFGTFGWGDRYLLSELEERLNAARDGGGSTRSKEACRSIESHGGLRQVALDLLASSMAGWRDRREPVPAGLEQNWSYWEDPRRLARRARLFLPARRDTWLKNADAALDALGSLLSRGTHSSSVAALVQRATEELPMVPVPEVVSSQRRSAASVLAVSSHLAPRTESDSHAELERFLARLPAGLLGGALSLGEAILHIADVGEGAPPTGRPAHRLIDLLRFIQRDQQAEVGGG